MSEVERVRKEGKRGGRKERRRIRKRRKGEGRERRMGELEGGKER